MNRRVVATLAVVFLLIVAAAPFAMDKVWVGSFPLTVIVETDEPIDELLVAICWTEVEAPLAVETGSIGEA